MANTCDHRGSLDTVGTDAIGNVRLLYESEGEEWSGEIMELKLMRDICGESCTEGTLTVDGVMECYTIEDTVRAPNEKIPGETAIPDGRYKIIVNHSQRFNRELPLLVDVPNFSGVRIHPGNTARDTEGCILVGRKRVPGAVQESRLAFDALFHKILIARAAGEEVWIEIA
jgi:hypothetical protein